MRLCFPVMLSLKSSVCCGTVASRWLEMRGQRILDKVRHSEFVLLCRACLWRWGFSGKRVHFYKVGKLQISDPTVSLTSGVVEGLAIGMTETNLQGEIQAGQLMNSEERKSG